MFDGGKKDELRKTEEFGAEILKMCVKFGGVLTGEHGVTIKTFPDEVLIALGNLKKAEAIPVILSLLTDPAPIVRGSAIWALSRTANIETFLVHKTMLLPKEDSTDVISEWNNSQRELELNLKS